MSQLKIRMGPALKYDTVDIKTGIYHGFALIVTEDNGSDYSVTPTIRLTWEPAQRRELNGTIDSSQQAAPNGTAEGKPIVQSNAQYTNQAVKLHHYDGHPGPHTVWRFKLEIPLADVEQKVTYSFEGTAHPDSQPPPITDGSSNTFWVPSKTQDFRWIGHSCNGFSASIPTEEWGGPNPLWDDVMREHQKKPFHTVVGGGDQLYNDPIAKEPELKEWHESKDRTKTMAMKATPEIRAAVDRYLFNHYCDWFGSGTFSKVIAQVPMMNMTDDHDLIDGFGSYPANLMTSPIFNLIGERGLFWYFIFQQFLNPDVDGQSDEPGKHPNRSLIIGGPGAWVPYRNHSFLAYLGPKQWILLIDGRAERKLDQVVSQESYNKMFSRVDTDVPAGVEHLVMLIGVPLAYPRMVFAEKFMSASFNPLISIAKKLSGGFTNNFDAAPELLDDLNDHLCAAGHKKERNELVCRTQEIALRKKVRVSWISGDVHCPSASCFRGYNAHDPKMDPKFQLAVVTSAIVNAPPPPGLIYLLNKLARKKHRSLLWAGTKEESVPVFEEDLQGHKQKDKYIVGARNWCAIDYDPSTGELIFDLRVEKEKGKGQCKSYPVKAPPPRWEIPEKFWGSLHKKGFEKEIEHLLKDHHRSQKEKVKQEPKEQIVGQVGVAAS